MRSVPVHPLVLLLAGAITTSSASASPLVPLRPELVEANDNRRPAGTLANGTLSLSLRAARGTWHPEGPEGPSVSIEAFGEVGGTLSVPAPLLRMREGTHVVASIRNDLEAPLAIHGESAPTAHPSGR
jgi:hypothetical protein